MSDENDQYQFERPSMSEQRAAIQKRHARSRKLVIAIGAVAISLLLLDLVLEEVFDLYILFRSRDSWEMLIYTNRDSENVESAVYYTGHVKREDAEKLGAFLVRTGVFSGPSTITVVLSRTEEAYVVSVFIRPEKLDDQVVIAELQVLRKRISTEAFAGELVIIQMCERTVWPAGSHPMMKVETELRD
jgi:hypothetical protein